MVPTPAEAVKLLMGEMATVILDGQRVVPKRALDLGFRFRFPDLGLALRDALGT
jgi:NAD dependent epimerase/dehydratase family enzyme